MKAADLYMVRERKAAGWPQGSSHNERGEVWSRAISGVIVVGDTRMAKGTWSLS